MKTVLLQKPPHFLLRMVEEMRRIPPATAPTILAAGILFYLMSLREAHFGEMVQLATGWACLVVLFVLSHIPGSRRSALRIVFILVSGYLTLRYIWWRTFETLIYTNPWDFIGMTLLYLAELYSVVVHVLGLFVNFWPMERKAAPLPEDRSLWPAVDVFIPTYSEPEEIVRLTALAASQIEYPPDKLRLYILDDGGTLAKRAHPDKGMDSWARRYRLKEIAREVGAEYLTRESNRGAKAGNLNHALSQSRGDLVLFLDCDHVPTVEILKETVGYFLADEKCFLVQTPHFFANAAPTERQLGGREALVPDESEMFYRVIHPGLDSWNASYFCGSAAIMRRTSLMEVGGVCGQSITEDAETAFELHRRGYNSVYLNKPMICGLAPERYTDYMVQHTRWAQGMVQIFVLHQPLFVKGLTLAQRLCYFNCCLFWFFGIARVLYFIAPAAFLIFGMSIYHASALQVLSYALPYVASTFIISDFLFGRTRRPFFSELYESVQSVFLAPAVLDTMRHPHRPTFKVTPKGIGVADEQLNSLSLVFFALLCLNLVAAGMGFVRIWLQPEFRGVIMVTLGWSIYNIFLATLAVGALWERRQVRQHHRILVAGEAMVQFPRVRQRVAVEMLDLSLAGMSVTGKLPFQTVDRERVVIEVAGADGLVNYFEGEIRRVFEKDGETIVGIQFIVPIESHADVVRFVYGDSRRWSLVWEARAKSSPLFGLLFNLWRTGVRGVMVCTQIIAGWVRDAAHGVASRAARRFKTQRRAPDRTRVAAEEIAG